MTSIGATTSNSGLVLLKESIISSPTAALEMIFPGRDASPADEDGYDLINIRFYNVTAANNNVWFRFALSYSVTGTAYTSQSVMHQIARADKAEGKWWNGGTNDTNNRRLQNSDSLYLAEMYGGTSGSTCCGSLNIFDIYNSTNHTTWWGHAYGDANTSSERAWKYWPSGYIQDNNRQGKIKFWMSGGNIQEGIFRMYGIRKR